MDGRDGLPGMPAATGDGYVAVPGPPGKFHNENHMHKYSFNIFKCI